MFARNYTASLQRWLASLLVAILLTISISAAPPQTRPVPADEVSDFGPAAVSSPAVTQPRTQPDIDSREAEDARIGSAIRHAVDFMLVQFRDGGLATAPELSDPQRQALDALCVYALTQANAAINDPRLSVHGNTLPALLDRLRTFDLTSDAQKMNRPLTYGRSLRAAALAVYDRPADRTVLKDDVAWLVKSQIGGGYTYDDFYNQMIRRGFRPRLDSQITPRISPPSKPATTPSGNGGSGRDFAGGSTEQSPADNPYPPAGPALTRVPTPPVLPGSGGRNQFQQGGQWHSSVIAHPYEIQPVVLPMRYPPVRVIIPPGPKPPAGNSTNKSHSSWGGSGATPVPLTADPKLDLAFDFPWDNSNSQYGLLGVWAGAEVGIEVPDEYWLDVEKHWLACQL